MAQLKKFSPEVESKEKKTLISALFKDLQKPIEPNTRHDVLQNLLFENTPDPVKVEAVDAQGNKFLKDIFPAKNDPSKWFTQKALGPVGEYKYMGEDFTPVIGNDGTASIPTSDLLKIETLLKKNYQTAMENYKDPLSTIKLGAAPDPNKPNEYVPKNVIDPTTLDDKTKSKIIDYAQMIERKALSNAGFGTKSFDSAVVEKNLKSELGPVFQLAKYITNEDYIKNTPLPEMLSKSQSDWETEMVKDAMITMNKAAEMGKDVNTVNELIRKEMLKQFYQKLSSEE